MDNVSVTIAEARFGSPSGPAAAKLMYNRSEAALIAA